MKNTMKQFFVISFFGGILLTSPAFGDCIYNGKTYNSGDIVNGYICDDKNNWKKYEE